MRGGLVKYSESVLNTAAQIDIFKHQLSAKFREYGGGGPFQAALVRRSTEEKVTAPMRSGQGPTDDGLQGVNEADIAYISRPESMEELHDRGIDGRGVTVAVIDSGVTRHEDFGDRIKAFKDFGSRKRAPHDPKGHGTHVAGIILGDGDKVDGVAPKADLVAVRISSEQEAIEAVDWVIANKEKYSIDVLNLSLGVDAKANPAEDQFRLAAERAVDAGLVVVVSAGNECKGGVCPSTISSPGVSPKVITVGAIDDNGTPSLKDDKIWEKSSQGTSMEGKPDLVAPGSGVISVLAAKSVFADRVPKGSDYLAVSGSSQAAPMVAGAAALLLQVNPALTHDQIKDILTETANPLPGARKSAQGAGRLNLEEAVKAATVLKKKRKAS
jgi:serine protease AprX